MHPPFPDSLLIARLIAEVEGLRAEVRQLLDRLPTPGKTWLEPREIAALAKVSVRTIGNRRAQGRFRSESIRPTTKGWQFHATHAAADIRGF